MLNNISDFFSEKIAIFVTLKKITHLDFQATLETKYRKCWARKAFLFPQFFDSDFKPIFSLNFIICDIFLVSNV